GSVRVDVTTAMSVAIKDNKVHKVPLEAFGPLRHGLSALLLRRSSVTLQGLFVLPGIIDADFTGQIAAMVWTPSPPVTIPAQSHIAQLVPFVAQVHNADQVERETGGFGSTGEAQVFWTQAVTDSRPNMTCTLLSSHESPHAITIIGMFDTGADVTIIS
ncbi:hypothetical protein M959_01396, partial [Chaetura pelagica]